MVVSCLKCSENIENSVLESMFCHELARSIILIILGVIVSFIFYFISQNVKRILRNASSMLMFALFLAIWMLGFITYSIGAHVGDTHPFWSNAPMAIIRATLMFAAQSDISAIKDDCTSSPAYMCLFNLSHLLAVLVSFAFVLRHFGFHVVSKLRLLHHAYISGNTDNLYIFWGFNDAAFSLARSIPRIDEKGDKNQILVVRTDDEDDFEGTKMPIKRLLHSISLKNRELGRLEKLECLNVSCFARLSKIDVNDKNKRTNVFGGLLRLPCIPKLICKTNKTVSFFLLNNSYDANYKALENLLQDSSIIKNKNKIKMYCLQIPYHQSAQRRPY